MEIRFTSISNAKDIRPKSYVLKWDDLIELFAEQAIIPRPISDKAEFKLPALYPTVYAENSIRKSRDNVIGYGSWTAVDIDHNMTFSQLKEFFATHNLDGCIFTTTSHSEHDPRLRGVLLLSREIELSEFDEFWHALNQFFGSALDQQTKNINRIYYVPSKWNDDAKFERVIGTPLSVDNLLEQFPYAGKLDALPPEIVRSRIQVVRDKLSMHGSRWSAETAITSRMADRFRSRREGGRLFGLEVAIAKRALWIGYPITAPEVEAIAIAFDRAATGKKRSGTLDEAMRALGIAEADYALSCMLDEQQQSHIQERRDQNWVKPLSDFDVNAINAPCGAGKTYETISKIVMRGGKWLYVCDTIKNIKEREDEFRNITTKYNKHGFQICRAFYDGSTPVAKQVGDIVDGIYRRDVVIFITHAALQILDASIFSGFKLVIDEAYEVISRFERKWNCNIELADAYFQVVETESDYYQLIATKAGEQLVADNKFDDISDTFEDLLKVLAGQYTTIWVMKSDWEKRSESRIGFWVVSSPDFIRHFDDVWLIGDELQNSPIFLVWSRQYKVSFKFIPLSKQRVRKVPLAERGMIYYFTENRQASTNQFRKGDSPLLAISNWIIDRFKNDAFYYAYNETKGHTLADIEKGCKFAEKISLKATGINTLQHHTMCFWMGSMKLSAQERLLMETVFDIDHSTQVRWREYNPLYQFAMRSALRDYQSDAFVSVYVFDRYQAEYLAERTGMPVQYVGGVVKADVVNKGGRPPGDTPPMTSTERSRAWRARQKAELEVEKSATKTPIKGENE